MSRTFLDADAESASAAPAEDCPEDGHTSVLMSGHTTVAAPVDRPQNLNFNPTCACRIGPAVVIRPTVAVELMLVPGLPRFTMFKALVASPRNSRVFFSESRKARRMLRSTFFIPGPSRKLRAEFPGVPSFGRPKALGSNHMFTTSLRGRFGSRNGLPVISARALPVPARSVSTPLEILSPAPLRAVPMKATDQPPATARTARGVCLK